MSARSFPVSGPRSRSRGPVGEVDGRSRLPASPARPQGLPSAVRRTADASRATSISTNSASSSGSSLLDRMKAPSSRTSLEDNRDPPHRRREREGTIHQVRDIRGGGGDGEELEPTDEGSISGHGYDLWGRVTSVASKLTVNVNQVWQQSVRLADGEETPPGGESRLTKAMKAYHLERARSPADLPAWLFEDHERGVGSRTWNKKQEDYEDRFLPERQAEPTQRSGLRDVYDRAASSPGLSASNRREGESGNTRATDRLRAIRDAKRLAAQSGSKSNMPNEDRGSMEATEADKRAIPARIGLPSGPGRMRRS